MKHAGILDILSERFAAAVAAVAQRPVGEIDPAVRAAQDPKFGDYQCNVAMSLARPLRAKPREIAVRIVAAVDLEGIAGPPEIAGPGFINVRLLDSFVSEYLAEVPPPPSEPEAQAGGASDEATQRRSDAATQRRSDAATQRRSDPATGRWSEEGEHRRPAGAAGSRSPTPDPRSPPDARSLFPDRLGMPPVESPQRVVVDYSSPNIAKQMHVGHLRSTIIGDAIARVLMFEGHDVIRQNHVGDWGTQFGTLIAHYETHEMPSAAGADALAAIENDYRAAQQRFKSDPAFAEAARSQVGRLQSGDPAARRTWEAICGLSRCAFSSAYRRLNVLLTDRNVRGESFYNDRLAAVVDELSRKLPPRKKRATEDTEATETDRSDSHDLSPPGAPPPNPKSKIQNPKPSATSVSSVAQSSVAQPWAEVREDAGALCIFFYDEQGEPRFRNAEGEELPMIIRKSDGAYLYATTDLAAIKYRLTEMEFAGGQAGAQRIIYVTDARQKLHFEMLFAAARAAGWADDSVRLEHVTFGSVLGNDNRPLKTREGENVKLQDLLDEAERRAETVFADRDEAEPDGPDRPADAPIQNPKSKIQNEQIARAVGIAAVKYFDLNRDRQKDYVFDWDRMLAMQGNTAPYMMYAYARIRSIYRKAAERFGSPDVYAADVGIALEDPAERALAMRLARFREMIDSVAGDLSAHVLCNYLYETAAEFMRFYEACPVLQAPEPLRLSRMRLCDLTARTLALGMGLLGIEVIDRM